MVEAGGRKKFVNDRNQDTLWMNVPLQSFPLKSPDPVDGIYGPRGWQLRIPQMAVVDPVDGSGRPRRWQWRTPSMVVADPVDGSGGLRRWQWRTPSMLVEDPVDGSGRPRGWQWQTPWMVVPDPVDGSGGRFILRHYTRQRDFKVLTLMYYLNCVPV